VTRPDPHLTAYQREFEPGGFDPYGYQVEPDTGERSVSFGRLPSLRAVTGLSSFGSNLLRSFAGSRFNPLARRTR
jgi:hypothetical protein